eukprot:6174316-Pleurochrysis_carterae.AAC.1
MSCARLNTPPLRCALRDETDDARCEWGIIPHRYIPIQWILSWILEARHPSERPVPSLPTGA